VRHLKCTQWPHVCVSKDLLVIGDFYSLVFPMSINLAHTWTTTHNNVPCKYLRCNCMHLIAGHFRFDSLTCTKYIYTPLDIYWLYAQHLIVTYMSCSPRFALYVLVSCLAPLTAYLFVPRKVFCIIGYMSLLYWFELKFAENCFETQRMFPGKFKNRMFGPGKTVESY
jgi:hypothetical protein